MKLSKILQYSDDNLAKHIDDEVLAKIGSDVVKGYEDDLESRREWEERNAEALKLAMQVVERKSFPWPGAANIKYPLVLTSCIQFNARAYPALVPSTRVVDMKLRPDAPMEMSQMAAAVSEVLNWEILTSGEWEDGQDLLLMMLPLIGTVFKKTYFDPEKGQNCSIPLHPSNFVVDYWARSLDGCERKTHVQYKLPNEVEEKKRLDYYLDVDISPSHVHASEVEQVGDDARGFQRPAEASTHRILEQCCWLDLDEDGYKEPYVATVDYGSRKVLRLADNFKELTLIYMGSRIRVAPEEYVDEYDGFKVGRITENNYYTKYGFIRSADGGFYDVGLGTLLGPVNRSVDSILNQLVDAGTLSNAQGGLLSRNIRTRSGQVNVAPGRWIRTDASGEELRNGVFPWPVKEPSMVLFQLLGLLMDAGQKIGSVSDTMMGQNPGQNQAATTTMTVLEQGLQVFSAIYKRVFRSMTDEFRKWYELNRTYAENPELYQLPKEMIVPTADPSSVAQSQKMLKAEALKAAVMQAPHLYGFEGQILAEKRYLEALGETNADELLANAQPPQDPEAAAAQAEAEQKQAEFQHRVQMDTMKESREQERTKSTIMKDMATVKTKIANSELAQEKQAWQQVYDQMQVELDLMRVTNERIAGMARASNNSSDSKAA